MEISFRVTCPYGVLGVFSFQIHFKGILMPNTVENKTKLLLCMEIAHSLLKGHRPAINNHGIAYAW